MTDYARESVELHGRTHGKLAVRATVPLSNRKDLSLAYTPGVAQVCLDIAAEPTKVFDLTIKRNTVAVVSDGTAILGLGDLGPSAAIPVMEGKAVLFKEFANVDAFPICLNLKGVDEIVAAVRAIAPVFGGINLEDISAPRCFEIEEKLQDLGIPVFHDDQHGTAVVVLAALFNALKVSGKDFSDCRVVFSGCGASAIACARLIMNAGERGLLPKVGDMILLDSQGIVHKGRTDLNKYKADLAQITNNENRTGGLAEAMRGADVFIGLSQPNIVTAEMVQSMRTHPIVFAMANPVPEIMPELATAAGAAVVGTGRSDFPNQINNVLAFPGIFRGALDAGAKVINDDMKITAAQALAALVIEPSPHRILPDPLDKRNGFLIGEAVEEAARRSGVCR